MDSTGLIGIVLIIVNFLVSWQGFKDPEYFEKYCFDVDEILVRKDYKRIITAGFLHVNWLHLILNMMALYSFSAALESDLGSAQFLTIYFLSLTGGNLFSLFIHRNHSDYSAVGASGAISGVIFASIAVSPGIGIGLIGLPFSIPGWAFGLAFVLFSIYGIKSQRDNIGHDAHLGGGIAGLLIAVLMKPESIAQNYPAILAILLPSSVFLYIVITRPEFLMIGNFSRKNSGYASVEDKYRKVVANKQMEIDRILDKISAKGINSLTKEERETLDKK
jgi:membrane associated rhomboid family serine protease